MSDPRYAIGIDLGTTHCALSYIDITTSDGEKASQEVLAIQQLTGPGEVEGLDLLPSFVYLPHPDELASGDLELPWGEQDYAAGEFARNQGAQTPIRLVSSAKSWLCHSQVDRKAPILPSEAPDEVARISPLEASIRYLSHMREAWNHAQPDAPINEQEVTITIPASFDPVARQLTAEAAEAAGFERMTLLEEPQAALYSWLQMSGGRWRKQVKVGDIILVVDVGGGTTDLSLIAVVEREGNLELYRVAVGEHILLGGDNMDLALAHVVARKLAGKGTQLDPWQMRALTYASRVAKERLLSDPDLEEEPLVIPSRGSKLVGGSIRTELTREEVTQTILNGFFPTVDSSARPVSRARAGLTQLGLPYAQDAGVTRHLAAFLARHLSATLDLEGFADEVDPNASFLHPTAILFNGGVFKSDILADRTVETLNAWLAEEEAPPVRVLEGVDLDLAVARGAAYYSYVRGGGGVRIRGGTARAYYVGVESSMPAVPGIEPPVRALCVAAFGMEEGTEADLPAQEFGLVVGEPVRFPFFASSVRRQDQVGSVLDFWEPQELEPLDQLEATLRQEDRAPGEIVPVKLRAIVTESGTLELEALPRSGGERWKVEFDMRGSMAE
jgi:hypothetical protein